jgi:hypothetical protein
MGTSLPRRPESTKGPRGRPLGKGLCPSQHTRETQFGVMLMVESLTIRDAQGNGAPPFERLYDADRVTSALMRPVAHETSARNVYLDGPDLAPEVF